MGLFNRVFGGKPKEGDAAKESAPSTSSTASAPAPTPSPEPSLPSTSAPGSDMIRDIAPDSAFLKAATMSVGGDSSSRLYNPYEGISAAVGTKPHAFKLPTGPEFVFEEEAAVRRRGWTENLQFYTGLGYLAGVCMWRHQRQ